MEIKVATPFQISKEFWDPANEEWLQSSKFKIPRKQEQRNFNAQVDTFNFDFIAFKQKVASFLRNNPHPTKEEVLDLFYKKEDTPATPKSNYPTDFYTFVDFYISEKLKAIPGKQKPITKRTEQKYRTIQNRVKIHFPKIKITDIDDNFRDRYSLIMEQLDYMPSYIIKELKYIKAFCTAASKKLKVNPDIFFWKFIETDKETFTYPIFSFEELHTLANAKLGRTALSNARDWLLISCYTGQRVSDLLKMNSENIIDSDFYSLKQQKGQKDIVIYLMPQVKEILRKHNGEFPPRISDQKYNEYIKLVAQACSLNTPTKGGKIINNRKVIDIYEKWELVSSHIGRRTFVSLFQPIIGTENIKTQTGHTTNKMVELYNKTLPLEKAKRIKNALNNSELTPQPPNAYNE